MFQAWNRLQKEGKLFSSQAVTNEQNNVLTQKKTGSVSGLPLPRKEEKENGKCQMVTFCEEEFEIKMKLFI